MKNGTEKAVHHHRKAPSMTTQNQLPATDRLRRAEDVRNAANAFFDTLKDTDDVLTVFNTLRSRFNLIGTVFTDRDVRDILVAQMEGNELDERLDVLLPSLTEIVIDNHRVRKVAAESMVDPGADALEYDIADYIHPLVEGEREGFPVVLTVDGSDAAVVEFTDPVEAVEFAQDIAGSTVADALSVATNRKTEHLRTIESADLNAQISATYLALVPGGDKSDQDVRVKIG